MSPCRKTTALRVVVDKPALQYLMHSFKLSLTTTHRNPLPPCWHCACVARIPRRTEFSLKLSSVVNSVRSEKAQAPALLARSIRANSFLVFMAQIEPIIIRCSNLGRWRLSPLVSVRHPGKPRRRCSGRACSRTVSTVSSLAPCPAFQLKAGGRLLHVPHGCRGDLTIRSG